MFQLSSDDVPTCGKRMAKTMTAKVEEAHSKERCHTRGGSTQHIDESCCYQNGETDSKSIQLAPLCHLVVLMEKESKSHDCCTRNITCCCRLQLEMGGNCVKLEQHRRRAGRCFTATTTPVSHFCVCVLEHCTWYCNAQEQFWPCRKYFMKYSSVEAAVCDSSLWYESCSSNG